MATLGRPKRGGATGNLGKSGKSEQNARVRGDRHVSKVALPDEEHQQVLEGYTWQVNWDPMTFGKNGEWDELDDNDPSPWEVHLWRVYEGACGPWPPWKWHEWNEPIAMEPPPKPRVPRSPLEYEADKQVQEKRQEEHERWLAMDVRDEVEQMDTQNDTRLDHVRDFLEMDEEWTEEEIRHLIQGDSDFEVQELYDTGAVHVENPDATCDYWQLPEIDVEPIEAKIERWGMWLDPTRDFILTSERPNAAQDPILGTTTLWAQTGQGHHVERPAEYYIDPDKDLDRTLTAAVTPSEFRSRRASIERKYELSRQKATGTGIFSEGIEWIADGEGNGAEGSPSWAEVMADDSDGDVNEGDDDDGEDDEADDEGTMDIEPQDVNSLEEDISIDESSFD